MSLPVQLGVEVPAEYSHAGQVAGQRLNASQLVSFVSVAQLDSDCGALPGKANMTVNDMVYAVRHTIQSKAWSASPGNYAVGDTVAHLGAFWYCNATAAAADVPGTSNKWTRTGAPYIS